MTLVALGLLLGLAGLLRVMVILIVQEDHQTQRQSLREQREPLAEAARDESKAA